MRLAAERCRRWPGNGPGRPHPSSCRREVLLVDIEADERKSEPGRRDGRRAEPHEWVDGEADPAQAVEPIATLGKLGREGRRVGPVRRLLADRGVRQEPSVPPTTKVAAAPPPS